MTDLAPVLDDVSTDDPEKVAHVVTVTRSGFPWEDVPFRFVAYDERRFAYAPTPEQATAELATVQPIDPEHRAER